MTELSIFLYTWIPVFVILIICLYGILKIFSYKSKQKMSSIKRANVLKKDEESFSGVLNNLIDSSEKNLSQIESEINSIRHNAVKTGMNAEQLKAVLGKLETEKSILRLVNKYGFIIKPLGGSAGKVFDKFIGSVR